VRCSHHRPHGTARTQSPSPFERGIGLPCAVGTPRTATGQLPLALRKSQQRCPY
jgi:hypothetical protein